MSRLKQKKAKPGVPGKLRHYVVRGTNLTFYKTEYAEGLLGLVKEGTIITVVADIHTSEFKTGIAPVHCKQVIVGDQIGYVLTYGWDLKRITKHGQR